MRCDYLESSGGPKCHALGPHEREAGGDFRWTCRGGGQGDQEEEAAVSRYRLKTGAASKAGREQEEIALAPSNRECGPADTSISDFCSRL